MALDMVLFTPQSLQNLPNSLESFLTVICNSHDLKAIACCYLYQYILKAFVFESNQCLQKMFLCCATFDKLITQVVNFTTLFSEILFQEDK